MAPCVEAVNLVLGVYSKGADVGFEGLSGNRMLDQSITGFDPNRTGPLQNDSGLPKCARPAVIDYNLR